MDPLGLFSSQKEPENSDDYEYYYDDYYDYSENTNRRFDFDTHASEIGPYFETFQENQDDLKSTSSENNKRLAFVHYVYPRTSQKSHFKQFEEKN